jgi:SAM-dependent methyltransferase
VTPFLVPNPDHQLNRASWDKLAAAHGQDAYYDTAGLVSGASSLTAEQEAALAAAGCVEFAGRRVLHVQSHIGFDAITFARRGAQVTAVDFSSVALAKARSLAERCGVEIEWVCADAIDLPSSLDERFDLAWATMGVLCWIGDVGAWMRAVARVLAPGGRLVLIDGHPLRRMLKSDPVRVTRPYGGGTRIETATGSDYATTTQTGPQVQFLYSLGEIVSAAAAAGLCVTQLVEHTELSCDICDTGITRESDGRYRRRVDGHVTPVLFTLIARR